MVAILRGAPSGARRRLSSGRHGTWGSRALALCAVLACACGGPQKGADEGGECFRDADCREGFVCIDGACSNDLDSLVSMVEGPSADGSGAVGNTSTDSSTMSVASGAGGSSGTVASGAGGSTGSTTSGAGGAMTGAGAASSDGATMTATVDGGAGGSSASTTGAGSIGGSGGSSASTQDSATVSTTTQGVSGAGGAP